MSKLSSPARQSKAVYQWVHDCDKPSMLLGQKKIAYTTGHWFWKKEKFYLRNEWETKYIVWTCPECKSEWSWMGRMSGRGQGWWSIRNRPVIWKTYETKDDD